MQNTCGTQCPTGLRTNIEKNAYVKLVAWLNTYKSIYTAASKIENKVEGLSSAFEQLNKILKLLSEKNNLGGIQVKKKVFDGDDYTAADKINCEIYYYPSNYEFSVQSTQPASAIYKSTQTDSQLTAVKFYNQKNTPEQCERREIDNSQKIDDIIESDKSIFTYTTADISNSDYNNTVINGSKITSCKIFVYDKFKGPLIEFIIGKVSRII